MQICLPPRARGVCTQLSPETDQPQPSSLGENGHLLLNPESVHGRAVAGSTMSSWCCPDAGPPLMSPHSAASW